MKVYRTTSGLFAERAGQLRHLRKASFDALLTTEHPLQWLEREIRHGEQVTELPKILAPIESQEVWAAGVTYFRSRTARMEESKNAGGGDFYDRVYNADRPELFFKSSPHRVVGPGERIRIRSDSQWNVPEPELTLIVNALGKIIGYTIGNDVSSRDIEGANPLYLPQAKVYLGSCALGPGVLMSDAPVPPATAIRMSVCREGASVFEGSTTLAQMRRRPEELVEYLFRDNEFPTGCLLMTGTGIIPPDHFTLSSGDEVVISIDAVGKLDNRVA